MPTLRLAANLSMLFSELPFIERFGAAADAGFDGVEFHYPYDHDPHDLLSHVQANHLSVALFNSPKGDVGTGEQGLACLPDRIPEFRAGIERAAEYAFILGCRRVHVLAGSIPPEVPRDVLYVTYIDNLKFAAGMLARRGAVAMIEPLNRGDAPTYFLDSPLMASDAIQDAGVTNLRLQFDAYHVHITCGNVVRTLEQYWPLVGHVQIADSPGRHEPGTGELDVLPLFDLLARLGYDGWIGCEYRPYRDTQSSLAWARPYLRRSP
jgi:hydroxypyruvate isomerase